MATLKYIALEVVFPEAGGLSSTALSVPAHYTLRMVLETLGWETMPKSFGVFGELRELEDLLAHGDRIECYQPLQVDPKEARRLRMRQAS